MHDSKLVPSPAEQTPKWYLFLISLFANTLGSHLMTGLRSQTFGCKSNRRKTSIIQMV
jgi:hypothetical protein